MADYSAVVQSLYERQRFGIKLGLANMEALLALLGEPHRKFPSILISGTNGKGSTAAFIHSILRAAGYRTGLYTSPHLQSFRERIQVDSASIGEADVVALGERIDSVLPSGPPVGASPFDDLRYITFFEFVTAMAFCYFAEQQVDVAVLEVGMGGRLDATNVVTPRVSVITGVEMDHCAHLGTSIALIAREKAGIIKPGGVAVVSALQNGALGVIAEVSRASRAVLHRARRDFWWRRTGFSMERQTFTYGDAEDEYADLGIRLLGVHQVANAAAGVRTSTLLRQHGFQVDEKALRLGLGEARWLGRFEILGERPVYVLDSAHNPDAARKLRATLEEVFPGRLVILVFGVMRDKDAAGILEVMQPIVDRIVVTRPRLQRAASVEYLSPLAGAFFDRVEVAEEVSAALEIAAGVARADDVVCVTGSIFTVAEARVLLGL